MEVWISEDALYIENVQACPSSIKYNFGIKGGMDLIQTPLVSTHCVLQNGTNN